MKYTRQLDSLRAIAVLFVVVHHLLLFSKTGSYPGLGRIGVNIFFVLSGFLITKILFENREAAMAGGDSRKMVFKNFYIRRTLRIFPVYYLLLLLVWFFPGLVTTNISKAYPYFLTYTSNFYFFSINKWDGNLSHLWSLAVEEQFYLLWPLLVLLMPKKYYPHLIFSFIACGIITAILIQRYMAEVLPFYCFDAFGLGALVAWQYMYRPGKLPRLQQWAGVAFFILLMVCIVNWFNPALAPRVSGMSSSIATVWLIVFIIKDPAGSRQSSNPVLNSRVLIFLGKISYGLYLIHPLIPSINLHTINKYINPLLPAFLYKNHWHLLFMTENAILVVLIPWLSYKYVEMPFLKLKKHFEYKKN